MLCINQTLTGSVMVKWRMQINRVSVVFDVVAVSGMPVLEGISGKHVIRFIWGIR